MFADLTRLVPLRRSSAYCVLESAGVARVAVVRLPAMDGDLSKPVKLTFRTEDGDAVAGVDYVVGDAGGMLSSLHRNMLRTCYA